MKTNCVRCKKEFNNSNDIKSHFSTICNTCTKERPEDLFDQIQYHTNFYLKGLHG